MKINKSLFLLLFYLLFFLRRLKSNYLNKRNKKRVNIIGLKNIECSTSENIRLLEKYLKEKNLDVFIFDIKDIDNVYNFKNNIICIQPFDIKEDILKKFIFKPSALWVWEFKDLPIHFKKIYSK